MNKESVLKHTSSYRDRLLKRLKDPEMAQAYLEAAVESYEREGETQALLLAMRDVAEAQGGIGQLAKRTTISRPHLYDILASKHEPRLDNWLSIISGLGFRIRLEPQETRTEPVLSDLKS
ncbi:transcriptional regulator [Candidatus Poribacteria bacterium]|nr:transcriptional regulator [Candidatus Poribacteria bacterium]